MELLVARETVVRSMDKENFNAVIKDDTAVKILKINSFDITDEKGEVIGITNSFVVRLTKDNKNKIATLPGKVLFSSKVLQTGGEKAADTTIDSNFDAFYEAFAEAEDKDINLKDFATFTVIRTSPLEETRPNILSKQGNTNPKKHRFQLSDYTKFAEVLEANGGKYAGLDYDAIYESGPKSSDAEPLKAIFITKE